MALNTHSTVNLLYDISDLCGINSSQYCYSMIYLSCVVFITGNIISRFNGIKYSQYCYSMIYFSCVVFIAGSI